ncbi:hypothetical protein NLI96_g13156 [Meripilus lineatus]|uniref:Uncharacterized protein n=1 Tax=Meripilus lineatus TaxID=2056292 RepID=A0AAD5Y976_9APHY|nr:hypothetical protein NLI96_g13156 [Physisporinus lineatus]
MEAEAEIIETDSRCASTHKRRKRGRKGKGVVPQTIVAAPSNNEPNIVDKTLTTLAEASQALARELSRTSRNPSQPSVTTSAASIHSSAATTTNIIYSPLEQTSNVALQSPLVQVPSSSSLTSSLKAGVTSSTVSAPSPLSSSVTNIPNPHSVPLSSSSSTSGIINANSPLTPPPVPAALPTPTITKKPSKWRLGFGKGSHGQSDRSSVSSKSSSMQAQSPVEQTHGLLANGSSKPMSTTASNVTNLLMGLNPSAPASKASSSSHVHNAMPPPSLPASSSVTSLEETSSIWQRGRKPKVIGGGSAPRNVGAGSSTWGPSGASSAFGVTSSTSSLAGGVPPPLPNGNGPYGHGGAHMNHSTTSWGPPSNGSHSNLSVLQKERAQSPTSLRSGRHGVASSAASVVSSSSVAGGISSNGASSSTSHHEGGSGMKVGGGASRNSDWRASMSSLGGVSTMSGSSGSSAFTRLSNGSQRSVSTAATSVSASSWRSNGSKYPYNYETGGQLPPNVKLVTGTPWELDQLPRQMYANPDDVRFGSPPVRNKRRAKQKDPKLDTINEWSGQKPQQHGSSPLAQRQDAMTSTTGLDGDALGEPGDAAGANGTSPRKVQKGQINALAKMLSALRR